MIFFFPSFSNLPIFCEFPIGAYEALEIQKTGREMKGRKLFTSRKKKMEEKTEKGSALGILEMDKTRRPF